MRLILVQMPMFVTDWHRLGLTDEDLRQLEKSIMDNPLAGVVMRGTGGARKIRYAPPGRGKSGGFRVIYGHFPAYRRVYFFLTFGKNEQANLTYEEQGICQHLMKRIADSLKARYGP